MAPEFDSQPEDAFFREVSHLEDASSLDSDVRDFDGEVARGLRDSASSRQLPAGFTERMFQASRPSLSKRQSRESAPNEVEAYPFPTESERLYPTSWWKHAAAAAIVLIALSLVVRFANVQAPPNPPTPPNTDRIATDDKSLNRETLQLEWLEDGGDESFIGIEFESELASIRDEIEEAEDLFMLANIEDASSFFADSSFDRELEDLDSALSQF